MSYKSIIAGAAGLLLAACQHSAVDTAAADPQPSSEAHALAQAACSQCHSVEPYGLSSNPNAPEWAVIANTPGLTRESLTTWLTEAHNYPEQMDFYLEEDEVDLLVDYMLTLRREGYQPVE